MIGIYETVCIDIVRDDAKKKLLMMGDSSGDDFIDGEIIAGLKSLNCSSTLRKVNTEIDICDGFTAELPCGIVQLLSFRFPCNSYGEQPQFYDKDFYTSNKCIAGDDWIPFTNTCQVDQGLIRFNQEQSETKLEISALFANVDEMGQRIIYERYMMALSNRAAFNYGLAHQHLGKFTRYQLDNWEKTWILQRDMLIGQDAARKYREEFNQITQILRNPYYVNYPKGIR